jgi:hypothetical protein
VEELSKFKIFRPNLEGENFCVQFLFVDDLKKLSMFLGNGG